MLKKTKTVLLIVTLITGISFSNVSFGFDFGASAVLIAKLLVQHALELTRLEELLRQGKDAYELTQDVYRGIKDNLKILKTLEGNLDPGTFQELKLNLESIIEKVERIYGKIPNTARREALLTTDKVVIDAIRRHNQIYDDLDKIKEERKWIEEEIIRRPSPGRSEQLTTDISYEILKTLSRIEKNQAMSIKLLATSLGQQNEIEKKRAQESYEQYDKLFSAFSQTDFSAKLPTIH